jgi:hypothetical protein
LNRTIRVAAANPTRSRQQRSRPASAVVLAAAALVPLLLLPSAHARPGAVVWTQPTKADESRFRLLVGSTLTLTLTAQASSPTKTIRIEPVGGMPPGATITTDTQASRARAVFRWRPTSTGEFTLRFVASAGGGAVSPVRRYLVSVQREQNQREAEAVYPRRYGLANKKIAHWADVERPTVARAAPRASARAVATLAILTPEHTQEVVLVLEGIDLSPSQTWYRIRLPILPNNSTGWVPKRFLGDLVRVDTHLFIDRTRFTATLTRKGVAVFKAPIGVGENQWPTPPGQFYIRSRITNFGSAAYGPLAFGTSARSATLTDWPGGGFVGIHGTNQPEILPGRVSHGCIRLRNPDILRLARLMKVGTPVTVR